ncbi:MAG TPA: zf-HC2 domain-containing protein [Candidatus Limnocylindria bacterium]|nr:zf-HC2 domain-containing protein [Candidatus Limnocylindria bacterium]
MTEHPDQLLSAYLDLALTRDEGARLEAHLAGCARCRAHLDELATTSRLIAGLPVIAPSRSLVPRVGGAPAWLRSVRALGSVATGAFLFLFLASAVLNSGSGLGGGTTAAERAASQGKFSVAASLAAQSPGSAAAAPAPTSKGLAQGAPSPSVAPSGTLSRGDGQGQSVSPERARSAVDTVERPQVGPSPGAFLAVALLCALIALLAHRRLRVA